MDRRDFLASLGAAALASRIPLRASEGPGAGRITLLHTNDTHPRIEPFGPGNGAISGSTAGSSLTPLIIGVWLTTVNPADCSRSIPAKATSVNSLG